MTGLFPYKLAFWRCMTCIWRWKSLQISKMVFRRLSAPTVLSRPFFGYNLHLDVHRTVFHQMLFLEGERLLMERHAFSRLVRPGMCVVDVGSNIGYYLLMYERLMRESGKIICFEPDPDNLRELKTNIAMNGFSNVELFEAAVGRENCRKSLIRGLNSKVSEGKGEMNIDVVRLDDVIEDAMDFLKIDVDGYEGQVLSGAERVIDRFRPVIFLEFHPHQVFKYGSSYGEIYGLLERHYRNISIYRYDWENKGALAKFRERYLNADAFERVGDLEGFNQQVYSGSYVKTFWVVCCP